MVHSVPAPARRRRILCWLIRLIEAEPFQPPVNASTCSLSPRRRDAALAVRMSPGHAPAMQLLAHAAFHSARGCTHTLLLSLTTSVHLIPTRMNGVCRSGLVYAECYNAEICSIYAESVGY